jgi:hypothetical protein
MNEAFRGDTILLRDGHEFQIMDIDAESGWPIVEVPGIGLITIDPVYIQEGWNDDRNDRR